MPDQTVAEITSIQEKPRLQSQSPEKSVNEGSIGLAGKIHSKISQPNSNPDRILEEIAHSEEVDSTKLHLQEQNYLQQVTREDAKKFKGLEDRYKDKGSDSSTMENGLRNFAKNAGVESPAKQEFEGKVFNKEMRTQISEKIQQQIDSLFNSERGSKNPDKQASVTWETQRYLDLILEAQSEGDVSSSLDASKVLALVQRNVWQLAYQDRAASEIMMGDHGVRHLIDHNIKVVESISDSLQESGQGVRAVDRLIMHQAMIEHDLGYAVDTVRLGYVDSSGLFVKGLNQGAFGPENGHNLLSAKILRQRSESPNDPLRSIFSQEDLEIIHRAILYHDSSEVDFRIGENTSEVRRANIESAVHVADNTHAFEDKLPELLYQFPESLKIMRLMKTAGEVGSNDMVTKLKGQLVESIGNSNLFSSDDKKALSTAVGLLSVNDYKFAVGRICGNKPEFDIDSAGKLTIKVTESAIHKEAVGLFEQKSYEQLKKFIGDLTGKDQNQVDMDQPIISANGKLEIKLKIRDEKATQETDYQRQLEASFKDTVFQNFVLKDAALSRRQAVLENMLKSSGTDSQTYRAALEGLDILKGERLGSISEYLNKR